MFLDSPDFLYYSLHLITIIATPLHILGFYCIVFKTPKAINSVKLTMLNLHIWCMILDWGLTVFSVPFLLFPALAGFPLGLWTTVLKVPTSWQVYLIITSMYTTCTGVVQIFENRYYHISGRNTLWRHFRVPFFTVNYILNVTVLIHAMTRIPEQTSAVQTIYERLPDLSAEIRSYPIFVFSTDYFSLLVPLYLLVSLIGAEAFVFCTLIYRKLNSHFACIRSRNTMILQRRFLKATYFQAVVLVSSFILPIMYASVSMLFDYYNQAGNNIVFIFLAIHGISSTIVMLWAHKPYRTVCLDAIRELKFGVKRLRMLNIPEERRPPRIVISVVV
ncbi:unnamed protein product [Caenorhabditis brenneri]